MDGECGNAAAYGILEFQIPLYHSPLAVLDITNEKPVHKSSKIPIERLSAMKNFNGLMAFVTSLFISFALNPKNILHSGV